MKNIPLVIAATFFVAMGIYALLAPKALVRPFGITIDTPEARSEIRAAYGGFGLAVTTALIVAALNVGGLRTGMVMAVAAALAGMALGRLLSRLTDQPTPFYPIWFYSCVEAAGATLLAAP
ncbi:DUF4345 family protein [Saccharothrix sp. NPDC042600]|uniref:DUF4345 family protein n=1 Tax=Saccharothrix TaxID=2071 RepID=UPI003406930D|nr:DUF4345 domain-containing protein [Saccharothrix mutabilis subsp. capreolus]